MACHRLSMKKLQAFGTKIGTKVVAFQNQVPCNTCKSKSSKMQIMRCTQVVLLLVALSFTLNGAWAAGSGSNVQQQVGAPVFGKRVGDNTGGAPVHLMNLSEESEEQQLSQLHQVVDTMTNLLNEQELQQQQQQQQQPTQASGDALRMSLDGPELMSESEIRLALKELEKVQQQEKQLANAASESRPQPVVATDSSAPKSAPRELQTQSTYGAAQLDAELADELADEQLGLASQEAKRILKQGADYPPARTEIEKSTVVSQPTTTHRPQVVELQHMTGSSNTSGQPQPLPSPESLYIGRLHSLNSELGPTLTDDFYSFHADQKVSQERPAQEQQQVDSKQKNSPQQENTAYPFNDLDSAAQTRNFRQDTSHQGFAPPPQPPPNTFRPQLDSFVDNSRPPAATLLSNTENFWRPAGSLDKASNENQFNQQQFNTRHFNNINQQHQLPPLPKSKFHSIPPTPFPQAPPQPRQSALADSQHVHFTGHSFIQAPSSPQQQFLLTQSSLPRDSRLFTTTSTPMISVLTGSDTSNGNSVSWDPPATINPPPAGPRVFNSIFPVANQQLPELQTFFPPPTNRGQQQQQGLVFNQPPQFQLRPETAPSSQQRGPQQKLQAQPLRPEITSTELDLEPPETSTYDQVQPSVSSTPRTTISERPSQFPFERETATSELQPSSRLISNNNNNLRGSFLGHESSLPVTSTATSIQNTFARPSNLRNQQATASPITTTSTTTAATTTLTPETTTNSTKKDDMVIYYYYYYDDNKNATVVAKNQTSRPPTLDEAIEADSGVEDTPYIEDSAPLNNAPRNRPQPSTSTTTTTTTAATSVVPVPTTRKQLESALLKTSIRNVQPSSTLKPSFKKQPAIHPQDARLQNDERRINLESVIRAPQPAVVADQFSNPFTPTPLHSTPTTSFRPAGFNNRQQSSISSSTDSSPTRLRPEVVEPVSNLRINKQQQVEPTRHQLNQAPAKPKLAASPSPVSTSTSSSSSNTSSRASNANRYGTSNNNLFLESYGIDPSSTSSMSHGFGHADIGHHQKNWQVVPQAGPSSGVNNKKPHSKPVASLPERPVQKSNDNNQHFAPQRQSNSRNLASVSPKVNQAGPPPTNRQPQAQVVPPNQLIANSGKKFFSEASSKLASETNQAQEFDRGQTRGGFTGETERINLEDQVNASRENLQRFSNNGRPSSQEGNTRNGFTKAPPQFSSTSATSSSSSSTFTSTPTSTTTTQRVVSTSSSETPRTSSSPASSTTQSSTVGSTLSSIAQHPPTVSYSQTESVRSSVSSSSSSELGSSSPSSTDSSTVSANTQTAPSSSTTEATPASSTSSTSTTESADRFGSLVTRRKFGNRNNRFQTRLDSISNTSKSTTSTTTTTPSPAGSTSTTKRPLSSTTRRSSKQLFAGRRRLNSPTGSEPAPTQNNSSVASNPTSSTESSVSSTSSSRTKFGNSFTSKSRSTTTNPSENSNPIISRLASGSRARLAFSRTTKPAPVASSTTESVPSVSPQEGSTTTASDQLSSSASSSILPDVNRESKSSATEKSIQENPLDEVNEASPANSIEDEPNDKREQSTPSSASTITTTPGTGTSTSTSATTTTTTSTANSSSSSSPELAKPKPKVRPLFASRQKNTALFGNRRNPSSSRR